MEAHQANKLLLDYKNRYDVETYKYVHAICPYVIDRWNLVNISVVECYYKNTGDLVQCPNTFGEIFRLWGNKNLQIK